MSAAPPQLVGSSLIAAPALLGATIVGRGVEVRITEVEAYMGADDPGSHGFMGLRRANRHLFGPPGTMYAYRSYGIHTCVNVVCGPAGTASGVLLRAGRVCGGLEVARARRGVARDVMLARGPGNLGSALGAVLGEDDGTSLLDGTGPFSLVFEEGLDELFARVAPETAVERLLAARTASGSVRISRGPRTGIRGPAGGAAYPWRFWLTDDPTVSPYRRHPRAEE